MSQSQEKFHHHLHSMKQFIQDYMQAQALVQLEIKEVQEKLSQVESNEALNK